jgi:hypothetical protein
MLHVPRTSNPLVVRIINLDLTSVCQGIMAASTRRCLVQKLRLAGDGVTTPGNEHRIWLCSYWAW